MLGPLEVRAGSGEVLEVGGARLRTLLIMLALRPGQVVPARQLIDGLWAEQVPSGAPNALQALVSRLRRTLPEAVIESRPAGYQLALDPRDTDVVRFEELAATGQAQLRADPAAAAATLREALRLWRGPALVDVAGTEFGAAIIVRLDERKLAAIEHRIDADLLTGVTEPLVAELEELVVAHPLREPLAARLMRALHASGRRSAALEVYEQTRKRLADQLGADPSAELAALHLELLTAAPEPAPHTNLRAELTSFVGRDAELAEVAGLLGAHRLLTLTGPGGAGKTRLAVEAARAELPATPDGVWLVELAPVTDPAEVPSAALAALGLREQALLAGRGPLGVLAEDADALGRLLTALAGRRALLVLDNCEHLVTAAARLADRILAACPQVRILATSREPLSITGEALWTVGPLTLPPDPAVTSDDAERAGSPAPATGDFAAVRLLSQRAGAVVPGFEVTAANAAAVARICRALDGMPLAIELAAARLRTMAPEQVAARLDDRFGLLTGGSRVAMPRHQTLRAVVDWSWDLLDEGERALWRRFSVFAGGATLEAAEQVCAGSGIRVGQVLDLLSALADKSLLTVRHGTGEPRYRMLEIIRAYGQERLAEAGEREEVRAEHARYFTRLAEASQDHLRGAQQLDWLARLAADQDNLHAAIRGTVAAGDPSPRTLLGAPGRGLRDGRAADRRHADARDRRRLVPAGRRGRRPGARLDPPDLAAGRPARPPDRDVGTRARPAASGDLRRCGGRPAPVGQRDRPDPARAHRGQPGSPARRGRSGLPGRGRHPGHDGGAVGPGGGARRPGHAGGLAGRARRRGRPLPAGHRVRRRVRQHRRRGDLPPVHGAPLWLLGERDAAWAELRRAQPDAERLGLPETVAMAAYIAGDLARLDGRPDEARRDLLRAVRLASSQNVAEQIRAVAATGLGYLAGAELGGASVGIRGTQDRSVPDNQRVADGARDALGPAAYGEACRRGQRVTLDTLADFVTPGA
jgi:predicted ATPase/DNA-binding SARP family transcriptional activator